MNIEDHIFDSLEKAYIEDSQQASQGASREASMAINDTLYFFPLLKRPYFPAMASPLLVEPGPYYELLKIIANTDRKQVGLLLTKAENADIYTCGFDDLYAIGVQAKILRILPMEQGGAQIILSMERRIKVSEPLSGGKFLQAKVEYFNEETVLSDELKAYAMSITATIRELLKLNPLFKEELQIFLGHSDFTEPSKLADFAVSLTTASREELQAVLEEGDIRKRIEKVLILLKKELDLSTIQSDINRQVEASLSKSQKEYFLKEQLKTIKKELGIEKEDKLLEKTKFEERLKSRQLPPDVAKVVQEEMDKFSALDSHSSEYGVCRGYLDWITSIPWGILSADTHEISKAEEILGEDHYGLEDIKQRILEFISVGKLTGGVKGSIICLVGPPGVGKTSIGKSIARALDRKFYRFSVGGMRDEAEIKGHRRTYVGAMPGKLIQALKQCQTMNPVIMLDEVDKIGRSYQGDPASALLEVLDPEQNIDFLDHYMDVRCNLSDVLFIVTANVLDTIPEPLKDRMEILRLSGYVSQEKIEIAKKFLIPRNRKAMGLKSAHIEFRPAALRAMINGYAREAGVRMLENLIKKIMRKVALKLVKAGEKPSHASMPKEILNSESLHEYLGKPVFTTDRFYERTPTGVCTGLAWTAMGGATLYVEAIKVAAEKADMVLTGQAGSVMKESANIAWSYLHSAIGRYAPSYSFFEKSNVHIHFPEGATPKDGPSAGITIVTALLSLLMDMPVCDDLGMTGELTLTGRVLAIGGVKEKIVAARRSGLKVLIFPKPNARDYEELPGHIKSGLKVHFVEHYDEVFPIAFPEAL
jgi:ATP-dependent Lon protease